MSDKTVAQMKPEEKAFRAFYRRLKDDSPFKEVFHKASYEEIMDLFVASSVGIGFLPILQGNAYTVSLLTRKRARDVANKNKDMRARERVVKLMESKARTALVDMFVEGHDDTKEKKMQSELFLRHMRKPTYSLRLSKLGFDINKYENRVYAKGEIVDSNSPLTEVKEIFKEIDERVANEHASAMDIFSRVVLGKKRKTRNIQTNSDDADEGTTDE